MDIRELIEKGNAVAGTQARLAEALGVRTQALADTKAGRQGLPDYACFRLAAILAIDPATVTAASALVTEKNEERRKVFYPFVMGKAATIAACTLALVILEMTPIDAQAALLLATDNSAIVIMSTWMFFYMLMEWQAKLRNIGPNAIKLLRPRTALT